MFASKITRLTFSARLLALQILLFAAIAPLREAAYRALTKYAQQTGLVAYAFDPNDEDDKAAVQAMIDEAVAGLKASNKKLLADLKKAKAGGEVDPAEVERLETELESLRGQLTDANKQLKAATTLADKAAKDLTTEQAHTQKLLVENGLVTALGESGVKDPVMLKAAAALIRAGQKIEIAVDGETRVAKIGDKSLGEFVKAWSQGDEGKTFVQAPGNSGGGAGGSGGAGGTVNPFAKDTFNLTEQGKLYTENPAQAKALAAAAGVTL